MKYSNIQFSGHQLKLKDFIKLVKFLGSGQGPPSFYKFLFVFGLFNMLFGFTAGILM